MPDVKLAKVDATVNAKLNERYQINNGFPKLKLFKNGSPTEYKGGRTAKSMVLWVKKNTGPAVIQVNDIYEARKLQQSNDVLVFGFFKVDVLFIPHSRCIKICKETCFV